MSLWPLCDPMDCSLSGSSVHWILQARTLQWVAFPFSKGSSGPRDWTWVSCIAGRFFNHLSHQGIPTSLWYEVIFHVLWRRNWSYLGSGTSVRKAVWCCCYLTADRNKQRCKDRTQREEIWCCNAPSLFFLADRILFSDRIGQGSCENFINI